MLAACGSSSHRSAQHDAPRSSRLPCDQFIDTSPPPGNYQVVLGVAALPAAPKAPALQTARSESSDPATRLFAKTGLLIRNGTSFGWRLVEKRRPTGRLSTNPRRPCAAGRRRGYEQWMQPDAYTFDDGGGIPNSRLPVLVYQGALQRSDGAAAYERLFADHGWRGAWRDGIFSYHHFHSTAHEVLGIAAGTAEVMLGGPDGRRFTLHSGDVVVLPAGTGHCNVGSSGDLLVVGAYPNGMEWDVRRGDPAERDEVLANIGRVPLPDQDPVEGETGSLVDLWGGAD